MSSRTEVLEEGPHGISSVESPQTELDMLENLNLKVKVTVMAICHSFHLNLCCAGCIQGAPDVKNLQHETKMFEGW